MAARVVHHYAPKPWPKVARASVPFQSKLLSAAWRGEAPALYVEKGMGDEVATLETFFVATGQVFHNTVPPFEFAGTVSVDSPLGRLFFHVYARVFANG